MKITAIINNKLKDTSLFRIALIIFGFILIVLREPSIFLSPRLWAEEATIFYAFARHHNLWAIFTTLHVGYLTLFNSIVSAIQAKLFSIENVPIVSSFFGFLIQLIPVYIIAFTNYKFWDNPLKKIICVFIVIIVTSPELYLNTTNSHFIFGLSTFFILLINPNYLSHFQKYLFNLLLFIGGLTGPASILLAPAFIIKAYKEKGKEKIVQACIIGFCTIIQVFAIAYSILYNNTYQRLAHLNTGKAINGFIIDNFSLGIHVQSFHLNFYFGVFIAIFFIWFFVINRKNKEYQIAMLGFVIIAIFSTLGSLDMAGSPRYAYIPTCILLMLILSGFFDSGFNLNYRKLIALGILCISILANIYYYKSAMTSVYLPTFPKWKDEVAKWRNDTCYQPMVPPATNDWRIKL